MPKFGRMNHNKITIILGAGASKAYQWSYPLLPDLLPEMLLYAEKLGRGHKQRLYLAFALTMAYELQSPVLEDGVIHADIIEEQFECVKRLSRNKPNINITKMFDKLETINNPNATLAYWALSHAIGFYMFQMRMADIGQSYIGDVDNAHGEMVAFGVRLAYVHLQHLLQSGHLSLQGQQWCEKALKKKNPMRVAPSKFILGY